MTISLSNVGQRFESMFVTDAGFPFPGVIIPLSDTSLGTIDFIESRFLMRVRYNSPVNSGTLVIDPAQRRFLMADHDEGIMNGDRLYRNHRLYPMTHQLNWHRSGETTDTVTGLKRGGGREDLGQIWVMKEMVRREDIDLTFRIKEEKHRIVTNAALELNDIIDNRIVKRVDFVYGVCVAELQ